jgi:hypothetical protein
MENKSHYEFLAQFTVPELKKIIAKLKKDFTAHFKGYGKVKNKDELIILILDKYIIDEDNFAKMKYGGNVEDIFKKREDRMIAKEAKKSQVKEAKKTAKMSKEKEARLAEKVKKFFEDDNEKIDFSNKEDIKNMKKSKKPVPEEDRIF